MIEKKEDTVSISSHISEPITLEEDPLPKCNADLASVILAESRQFLEVSTSRVSKTIITLSKPYLNRSGQLFHFR